MLLRLELVDGPIAFVAKMDSPLSVEAPRLQRLLLAYYRILQANRELPRQLLWSLSPLSCLIWTPGMDNGVRLLAIRCYALQSGMGEAEREKLELAVLGERYTLDCRIEYCQNADGSRKEIDGWVMPVLEVRRIQEMRTAIAENSQAFYDFAEDRMEVLILRCVRSPPPIFHATNILLQSPLGECTWCFIAPLKRLATDGFPAHIDADDGPGIAVSCYPHVPTAPYTVVLAAFLRQVSALVSPRRTPASRRQEPDHTYPSRGHVSRPALPARFLYLLSDTARDL